MFIAVLRYMSYIVVMFHISHIAMNMFDIIISIINNLLYVIVIMLNYGIKMI